MSIFREHKTSADRSASDRSRHKQKIEKAIRDGITDTSRDGFRADVTAYMFAKIRRGGKVNYRSYEPLREAIEGYLISSVKDMARIVTKSKSRDGEQQKKYSEMVNTLIQDYGYIEYSAEEIITFAANNLWRDS